LTCDFWAENGKRKVTTSVKAIESVASQLAHHLPGIRLLTVRRATPCAILVDLFEIGRGRSSGGMGRDGRTTVILR
jgi:hypothetical protein